MLFIKLKPILMDGLLFFEMKRYYIYKIVNPKGEVYVGCTSDIERRKLQYCKLGENIKGQRLIYESLKTYGYNNHSLSVLCEGYGDEGEYESLEMFWIRSLMSNKSKWPEYKGLNLTDGGKGLKGFNSPLKDKIRPKWVRDKMSKGCINKKQIEQLDINGSIIKIHDSMQAAASYVGGSRTSIHRAANNDGVIYKGYLFKYK